MDDEQNAQRLSFLLKFDGHTWLNVHIGHEMSVYLLKQLIQIAGDSAPTPTVPAPTPSSGFTCDGVLNGDGDVCCAAGCGECGGVGCSDRGGGLDKYDCCTSDIREAGSLCSVTGKAPCLVEGGKQELWLVNSEGDGFEQSVRFVSSGV